jgi:hypothetical protein
MAIASKAQQKLTAEISSAPAVSPSWKNREGGPLIFWAQAAEGVYSPLPTKTSIRLLQFLNTMEDNPVRLASRWSVLT